MIKETYRISGMTCGMCRARVQNAVWELPGIQHAEADLKDHLLHVEYEENRVTPLSIRKAVEDAGYGIEPVR